MNKKDIKISTSVRLSVDLVEFYEQVAQEQRRSRNQVIELALQTWRVQYTKGLGDKT